MRRRTVAVAVLVAMLAAGGCAAPAGREAADRPGAAGASTLAPVATPAPGTTTPPVTPSPTTGSATTGSPAGTPPTTAAPTTSGSSISLPEEWAAAEVGDDVLHLVYRPYGRRTFTGVDEPVVGDCFRGGACAFDTDALFSPALRTQLAERAAATGVDPVACTDDRLLQVVSADFAAGGWGRTERRYVVVARTDDTLQEQVRVTFDYATLRIVGVSCVEHPIWRLGGALPPAPETPAGAGHTVGEALGLVWDLISADEDDNPARCLNVAPCDELLRFVTPAFLAELERRSAAVEGMVDVLTCLQNTTAVTGRRDVQVVGHRLTVDVVSWWGTVLSVDVDLDRLRITDIRCGPPPVG